MFAVVVHGDAAGAETLRRSLTDWLTDMELVPALPQGGIDRYIGYYEPYATSHEALDSDTTCSRRSATPRRLWSKPVRLRAWDSFRIWKLRPSRGRSEQPWS